MQDKLLLVKQEELVTTVDYHLMELFNTLKADSNTNEVIEQFANADVEGSLPYRLDLSDRHIFITTENEVELTVKSVLQAVTKDLKQLMLTNPRYSIAEILDYVGSYENLLTLSSVSLPEKLEPVEEEEASDPSEQENTYELEDVELTAEQVAEYSAYKDTELEEIQDEAIEIQEQELTVEDVADYNTPDMYAEDAVVEEVEIDEPRKYAPEFPSAKDTMEQLEAEVQLPDEITIVEKFVDTEAPVIRRERIKNNRKRNWRAGDQEQPEDEYNEDMPEAKRPEAQKPQTKEVTKEVKYDGPARLPQDWNKQEVEVETTYSSNIVEAEPIYDTETTGLVSDYKPTYDEDGNEIKTNLVAAEDEDWAPATPKPDAKLLEEIYKKAPEPAEEEQKEEAKPVELSSLDDYENFYGKYFDPSYIPEDLKPKQFEEDSAEEPAAEEVEVEEEPQGPVYVHGSKDSIEEVVLETETIIDGDIPAINMRQLIREIKSIDG